MSALFPSRNHTYADPAGVRRTPGGAIDYNYYIRVAHRERSRALASIGSELGRAFRRMF